MRPHSSGAGWRLVHQGKPRGERRALADLALDGELAAVAVEDGLDQRQPETGAALGAALRDVDAVEALGQARQVLGRDARTMMAPTAESPFALRRSARD